MPTLTRQNSGGSSASGFSAGSGATSASRVFKQADGDEGAGHDQQTKGLTSALFGVLFTLSKEKNDSKKMALAAIFVDFFLLFVLMVTPDYPWVLNRNGWIWKLFWYAEFHQPIAWKGLNFYLVILYLLSGFLIVSVGMCVWVAWCFKNDHFPFLWPIQVLRVVVSLFFGMTYIVSLNIFIMMLVCVKRDGTWIHSIYLDECFEPPHIIHLVTSFVSSMLFMGVAFLMTTAEHDLEPTTKSLLAMPHSTCELRMLVLKTIIAVIRIVLRDMPKHQGIIFVIAFALMFYYTLKMLPNYVAWVNCLRCGLWLVCTYIAALLCATLYVVDGIVEEHPMAVKSKVYKALHAGALHAAGTTSNATQSAAVQAATATVHGRHLMGASAVDAIYALTWHKQKALTQAMWFGLLPVFLLGAGAAYLRLFYMWKVAMKLKYQWKEGMRYKDVHRFSDDYEVEIVARVMRVWDTDDNLDADAVDLAETVYKAGLSMFPQSAFLHIMYSNFLVDVRGNSAAGWSHLEQARKLTPNLSFRFSIFTREQEHKQQAAGTSTGEATVDLVSYVQFQRSHKMLMSYHRAAVLASREFWQLLLRSDISLVRLVKACRNIEVMEDKATKTFQSVLERYPRSAKLLRSYAAFLEQVKNDPWAAAKYNSEAEKAEEAQDESGDALGGEDNGGMGKIDEKVDAVVTINGVGIIQTANKIACKTFGYKQGELEHKNISILMPPPFSQRHNTYLRNYASTGKPKILDSRREVVALHKERFVFPVFINVTKVSGSGSDAIFMGVIRPIELDGSQLKAYLMSNGTVLCCDQSFTDCLGWSPFDLSGKPLTNISANPAKMQSFLDSANAMTEEELEMGDCQSDMTLLHKYGDPVNLRMQIVMGGTESQRLLVVMLKRLGPPALSFAIDHKGRMMYITSNLCTILGYTCKQLLGKDASTLLPPPYGKFHHRWLKEAEQPEGLKKLAGAPCKQGQTIMILAKNGSLVPVKMKMTQMESDGDSNALSWFIQLEKSHRHCRDDDRRISIRMNSQGVIASTIPGSTTLFNYDPAVINGKNIADVVDVFNMWKEEGNEVETAVGALMLMANGQTGASWRVGLLFQSALNNSPSGSQLLKKSSSFALKPKPAVMQIIPDLDDTDEDGNIMMTVHLWKAEALSAIVDVSNEGVIVRSDPQSALMFGYPATALQQQPLSRRLKLPTSNTMEFLMSGHPNQKRGGMSKAHLNSTGPLKIVDAFHADGRPMQVSFQAAAREGNGRACIQLLVKIMHTSRGTVEAVRAALMEEEEDLTSRAQTPLMHACTHQPQKHLQANVQPEGKPPLPPGQRAPSPFRPAFKLPLDKIKEAQEQSRAPSAGTNRGSQRESLATARNIDLDLEPTFRPADNQPATARNIEIGLEPTPRPTRETTDTELPPAAHWPVLASRSTTPANGVRSQSITPTQDLISSQILSSSASAHGPSPPHSRTLTPNRLELRVASRTISHDHSIPDGLIIMDQERSERASLPGEVNDVRTAPALNPKDATPNDTPLGSACGSGNYMRMLTKMTGPGGRRSTSGSDNDDGDEDDDDSDSQTGQAPVHRSEEDLEAAAKRKSYKKVQSWLKSDYQDVIHPGKGEPASMRVLQGLTHAHPGSGLHSAIDEIAEPPVSHHSKFVREIEMAELPAHERGSCTGLPHLADIASSAGESEGTAGDAMSVGSNTATFRKGKRLKRLMKIMCGKKAQQPLDQLRVRTWVMMAILVVIHLGAFILMLNYIGKQQTVVDTVAAAGEAFALMHRIMVLNRNIDASFRGYYFTHSDCKGFSEKLVPLINRMEYLHNGLYLGFKTLKRPDDPNYWALWHSKTVNVTLFKDADPPVMYTAKLSMWETGNQFVSAAREVVFLAENRHAGFNITANRFWQFIHQNGPEKLSFGYDSSMDIMVRQTRSNLRNFQWILLAVLVIEGCMLSLAAMAYMLFLLRHVIMQRVATFSVFLYIPAGFLKNMASKKMKLADDNDSDDEDEEKAAASHTGGEEDTIRDAPRTQRHCIITKPHPLNTIEGNDNVPLAAPSVTAKTNRRVSISAAEAVPEKRSSAADVGTRGKSQSDTHTKQPMGLMASFTSARSSFTKKLGMAPKRLVMNGKRFNSIWGDLYKVTWPFTVWSIVVISFYTSCFLKISNMSHFMIDIGLAYGVMGSIPRLQMFMSEAALVPQPDYQAFIQKTLWEEADELEGTYYNSQYGGTFDLHSVTPLGEHRATTMSTRGTLFSSKRLADISFRTKTCLASASSSCSNTTSQFYAVTRNAIDPMMMRLLEEARLMAGDRIEDLVPDTSTRYQYAMEVVGKDLREATVTRSRIVFDGAIMRLKYLKTLNVILFLLCIFLWIAFTFFTFKPFLRSSLKMGGRVAELLSQLPPDMDVEGMVQLSWSRVMDSSLQDDDDRDISVRAGSQKRPGRNRSIDLPRGSMNLEAASFLIQAIREPDGEGGGGNQGAAVAEGVTGKGWTGALRRRHPTLDTIGEDAV